MTKLQEMVKEFEKENGSVYRVIRPNEESPIIDKAQLEWDYQFVDEVRTELDKLGKREKNKVIKDHKDQMLADYKQFKEKK